MMSSLRPDLTTKIYPEPPPPLYMAEDHFDNLPDSLLLLIFNNIGDVKTLGRCSLVSKRFQTLIPHVQNVVVHVDCVISDDDSNSITGTSDTYRSLFSTLVSFVFDGFVTPIQAIEQFLSLKRWSLSPFVNGDDDGERSGKVTHHSPAQVLKNFNDIKNLKIELPSGELDIEDDVLLKWKADFGSTLDNCVMLGASSVVHPEKFTFEENNNFDVININNGHGNGNDDNGIITESASSVSKRTLVPALNMKLWYAPYLQLPNGIVLKGAKLVAIRPSEQLGQKEVSDGSCVSSALEEPYGTAARMLVKRRTYCLEMNSF